MGLPVGLSVVTVSGQFLDAAGNAHSGSVSFTPSNELTDVAGHVIVTTQTVTVSLGPDGSFASPPLAATDNTALLPAGWSYLVNVALAGQYGQEFSCNLPSSPSTVDFTALIPLTAVTPVTSFLTAQGGTLWGPLVLQGSPALKIPGGAASGDVLTSDSSGNATWRVAAGGSGTVTGVSVASANGFAGTVTNSTTTPALTLQTTVTGLLKGNGTAVSAAVSGTDYDAAGAAATETTRATAAEALALAKASNLSDVGTRQTALNNLAGAVTSGQYLRGGGTNVTMSAIAAADLPAASTSTQGAMKVGAGGYCLVVAASGATTAVKNSADYVCSGTGDQSTINTAIGALPGAGGTILLSGGTFSITGSINIAASNITLEGTGVSTKIQVTSGTNITQAISVSGTGTVEVKLRRFWVSGTITDSSGDGIVISTPWSTTDTQHVVEDIYVTGCPNNGIKIPASSDTRVVLFNRVHVKNCNGNGFYLAYPSCTDSVFTDCIADTIALNGFFIGGANMWFENCKAFYCGSGGTGNYGFYIVGYNNYFSGCQAQDNYYDGFFGDNTGDATYGSFGCTFVNCSGDANGQSASSSGLRGHGVQQWQVTGGLWMTRPYETSWTQTYGITWENASAGPSGLRPSSGNSVSNALFRNNGTSNINDTSTGPNYELGNVYGTGTAPSSLQGKLTLPSLQVTTSPANGYVLTSDGSGNGTWAPSAGNAASTVYNVKNAAYGALGNGQYVHTGAITSGQATLTISAGGATFAAGDVGKNIIIYGAGASGAHLGNVTISGFTDSTHVTVSANAGTTVTNAIVVWGTNDTTAIQAAVTAGGSAGSLYFPSGIYIMKSGLGTNLNGCRIYGDGAGSVAENQQAFASGSGTFAGSCIVMDTSNTSSLVPSNSTASFREFDHLSVVWTAAGGKIFASEGVTNTPAYIHDCRLEVNDPGGNGQVVASFVSSPFATWARCDMIQTAATRQLPLYQYQGTSSGGEANITFDQCQWYSSGGDHSQYFVDIEFQGSSSGGDQYSMQIAFRDCTFGRAWGGAVKMLGVINPVFDNCGLWDLASGSPPSTGNHSFYFGEYSASSPCRGVRMVSMFKNRAWSVATAAGVYDVYCESTTQSVLIEQFSTMPASASTGANLNLNFNSCNDVTLIGCQAPSGNNPGQTVVVNAPTTGVTVLNGAVTLTTPLALTSGGTGVSAASNAALLSSLGAAPLASPALTGTPTAPTGTAGDASTQVATDAFVATATAFYLRMFAV